MVFSLVRKVVINQIAFLETTIIYINSARSDHFLGITTLANLKDLTDINVIVKLKPIARLLELVHDDLIETSIHTSLGTSRPLSPVPRPEDLD
ncbi:hypothetical protein EST38_g5088 [Candolleomyces aberdarensis]|uniref:Uncharacterized protein n=1 Tax=Candolleomyces aberdarensis TaxID=2316362 RepID=A0A4Q2DLB3_9AGAR|nr:hypothetical protein EST38_g5088 [Candolleomyces aberdarensis]